MNSFAFNRTEFRVRMEMCLDQGMTYLGAYRAVCENERLIAAALRTQELDLAD